MLTLRITALDPERLFATVNCCIAKGSFALDTGGLGQAEIRGTGTMVGLYSRLMPANLITLAHFAVSPAMSLPKSAGDPARTMPPRSASFVLTLGSATPASISLLSLSMISVGVKFHGALPQNHLSAQPTSALHLQREPA